MDLTTRRAFLVTGAATLIHHRSAKGQAREFRWVNELDDNDLAKLARLLGWSPVSLSRQLPHAKFHSARNNVEIGYYVDLPPQYETTLANQGGRTRQILIDPTNPNIMFAAAVGGGVWKSTNGGATWTVLTDLLIPNIAVTALALQPNNTQVVYAGTGEGYFNGDAIRGAGIFKSPDGGTSWTQLASTDNATFQYVQDIVVSPRNTQRVYATNPRRTLSFERRYTGSRLASGPRAEGW